MTSHVLDEIMKIKDALPKKQQLLCQYLLLHYEEVGIMTVAELAARSGVGTTTVMRLVQTLGYQSYGDLKREVLNAALMRTTTSYRGLKQSFISTPETESSDLFRMVSTDGMRILENLCTPCNVEQFEVATQMLLEAETIFTLGMRSSRALALYFEYTVDCFYPHVRQLSTEIDFIIDRLALYMHTTDVLLVFSIWPCTKRTIEIAELCHRRGIPIILITNTSLNPIVKFAKAVIDTNSVNHVSGDVAIMAVVEAMVSELGRRLAPVSTQNIENIETILNENHMILREY